LIIKNENVESFYKQFPQFETFQRKNFEKRTATLQKRILSLLTLTAAEKYNQFIKDYSVFEKTIPNYQIASYLGITPQSLSRIRKERIKT
jgi:CRP-like cAMP-binding protein